MLEQELNACGLKCPMPMLRTKKALALLQSGDQLTVLADDPSAPKDLSAFCRQTGHQIIREETLPNNVFKLIIQHR